MIWAGDAVDQRVFVADIKTRFRDWLYAHINEDEYKPYWSPIGGSVEVYCAPPNEKPKDKLDRPRIAITKAGGKVAYIQNGSFGEYAADYERHEMAFQFHVFTDNGCGGAMAMAAVSSALSYTFAKYRTELDELGIITQELSDGAEAWDNDLYQTTHDSSILYILQCRVLRTIAQVMATVNMTATGQTTVIPGATITRPGHLQVRMTSGSRDRAIDLTVYATNQLGATKTLTGNIPVGLGQGKVVALAQDDGSDKFTSVTAVNVTEGSGVAGISWIIENIPEEID